MTFKIRRQIEVSQVGMALEFNSEHLGALSFMPVGPAEDICDRGHPGILLTYRDLDPNRGQITGGIKGHQNLETLFLPVDGRQKGEVVAGDIGVFLEDSHRFHKAFPRDLCPYLTETDLHLGGKLAELGGNSAAKFLRLDPFR
jgi:hypothetical protein